MLPENLSLSDFENFLHEKSIGVMTRKQLEKFINEKPWLG